MFSTKKFFLHIFYSNSFIIDSFIHCLFLQSTWGYTIDWDFQALGVSKILTCYFVDNIYLRDIFKI